MGELRQVKVGEGYRWRCPKSDALALQIPSGHLNAGLSGAQLTEAIAEFNRAVSNLASFSNWSHVSGDVPTAINTKHLCCITFDAARCVPEFLHSYFLMHPVARSYLESCAKGAIMAGLNMGIIKELPVALPSIKEQRRFVVIKKSLERQRAQAVSQESRSDELFAALQQHAFAGTL